MTCKDCIHYKVCCQKHLHVVTGMDFVYRYKYNHIERVCKDFKDRSRFVELPCSLGDEVFYFDTAGRIYTSKITQFIHGSTGLLLDSDVMFNSNLVGKRFFFSREAAEQALKEREK